MKEDWGEWEIKSESYSNDPDFEEYNHISHDL